MFQINRQDQRLIEESEIGIAILQCSIDEHCNASYLTDDHKKTKLINKLCSQTQDIMGDEPMICSDDSDDEENNHFNAKKRKHSIIPDSEQFQYENKITNFCVVKDTQPMIESHKSLSRDHLVDTSNIDEPESKIPKKSNNVWIEETQEMSFVNPTIKESLKAPSPKMPSPRAPSPKAPSPTMPVHKKDKKKQLHVNTKEINLSHLSNQSTVSNDKTNVKESSVISSNDTKSKIFKKSSLVTTTFKNLTKQDIKPLSLTEIKTQPNEDWHQKLPSKVYSKLNPPKESFVVKTETQVSFI